MIFRTAKLSDYTMKVSPPKFLKKKIFIFFAVYLATILTIYAFPIGLDSEWYGFYRYLDEQKIFPYIDVREGYPPIGFLVYMPLYWLSNKNPYTFNYYFRIFNGLALTSAIIVFYMVLEKDLGRNRALKYALAYSILPSIIISNTYSNDVVALLFGASAVYMMIKGRPRLCGLLIGLAALSKGFPALLILPTLIKFRSVRAKVESVGTFILTLLFISLPFLALNPLAYISTFTHHASRGPWETIWALIEGYYSHGGFLHPYFDKFFYHGNLAKIYTPNHYDHAFYLWRYDWLPGFLTISQVLVIIVLTLAYVKRPDKSVKLCGLIYLAYMLFFKGYSTQFAVSTSFYLLLASASLAPLIPLEVSHIMQIISWMYSPQINLRDLHAHFLISSILIRTALFIYMLISSLKSHILNLKYAPTIIKRSLIVIKHILSDKRILTLAALTIFFGCILMVQMYGYLRHEDFFESFSGSINLTVDKWENITLRDLKVGDKILIRLCTNTWIDAYATPDATIERGIRNQYNLRGSFYETTFFFRAAAEKYVLSLKMAHPKTPFRITDGFNGDLKAIVEGNGTILRINLIDEGLDGKDSIFRMAYPYEAYVGEDFKVSLEYKVISTNIMPTIILDIFDETDEWLYAFKTTEGKFVLTPGTADINGHVNLRGDYISLVALSIVIKDGGAATTLIHSLSINDQTIMLLTEDSEIVCYEIYVERAFKASEHYLVTLSLFAILLTCTILLAIIRANHIVLDSSGRKMETCLMCTQFLYS